MEFLSRSRVRTELYVYHISHSPFAFSQWFVSHSRAELSYRELQRECKSNGLSAIGPRVELRQRLREHAKTAFSGTDKENKSANDADVPETKADKAALSTSHTLVGQSIVDAYLCAITLGLPVDPVTAQDGRVYERAAIEKHVQSNPINLRSPITNSPMGPQLHQNPQAKDIIKTSIENGDIVGDLATEWQKRNKQKLMME